MVRGPTYLQALSVSMLTGMQQYLHLKNTAGVPSFVGRGGTVILSCLVLKLSAKDVLVSSSTLVATGRCGRVVTTPITSGGSEST